MLPAQILLALAATKDCDEFAESWIRKTKMTQLERGSLPHLRSSLSWNDIQEGTGTCGENKCFVQSASENGTGYLISIGVLFGKGAWGRSGSKLVSSVSLLPNLGGSDVSGLESRL